MCRELETLLGAVERAAENMVTAIEGGDLGASTTILKSFGAINSRAQSEETGAVEKFGAWLMNQRREVVVGGADSKVHKPRSLTNDPNDVNEPVAGERIIDVA